MKKLFFISFIFLSTFLSAQTAQELIETLLPQFTPNGDGVNETWVVDFPSAQSVDVKIYSRWGQLIFEGQNGASWDGTTLKDNNANQGVYIYVISIELNGTKETFKGTVGIIK